MSRIVITDPHGCFKTLMALIAKLPKGIPLTFAGDLIDRGRNSREVIEFVKNGGYPCVLGNHEVMMLDELWFEDTDKGRVYRTTHYSMGIWLMNGGDKCLDSYQDQNGVVDVAKLEEHFNWLKTLPYFLEYPELKDANGNHLLVTHTTAASVWGKLSPDNDRFKSAVTWEREDAPNKIPGIYNVYGHTPQPFAATIEEHYACIDTGAYFKRSPYGKLTALQFPEMIIYEQDNVESK